MWIFFLLSFLLFSLFLFLYLVYIYLMLLSSCYLHVCYMYTIFSYPSLPFSCLSVKIFTSFNKCLFFLWRGFTTNGEIKTWRKIYIFRFDILKVSLWFELNFFYLGNTSLFYKTNYCLSKNYSNFYMAKHSDFVSLHAL